MAKSEDKILEEYLAGKSDISKQYQKSEEPEIPKRIDDVVLSLAKFSLATSKPDTTKPNFLQKWQVPLSMAAVLVLSVSLVITLYDEYGQSYLDSPSPERINGHAEDKIMPATAPDSDKSLKREQVYKEQFSDSVSLGASVNDATESVIVDEDNAFNSPKAHNELEEVKKTDVFEQKLETLDIEEDAASLSLRQDKTNKKPDISEFILSDSLDESFLNKEQLKILTSEIEELKRAKSALAEERSLLKKNLQDNESKKVKIQNTLNEKSKTVLDDETIVNELKVINDMWNKGSFEKALMTLNELIDKNPNVTEQQLKQNLPRELVEQVINKN